MTFGLAVLTVSATAVGGDNVGTATVEVEEVTQLGGGERGRRPTRRCRCRWCLWLWRRCW